MVFAFLPYRSSEIARPAMTSANCSVFGKVERTKVKMFDLMKT